MQQFTKSNEIIHKNINMQELTFKACLVIMKQYQINIQVFRESFNEYRTVIRVRGTVEWR